MNLIVLCKYRVHIIKSTPTSKFGLVINSDYYDEPVSHWYAGGFIQIGKHPFYNCV